MSSSIADHAALIANETLFMNDLDGGLLPGDGNASHNYLVELDLSKQLDLNDGSNYKMSIIDPSVPELKDQALWANQDNTTLYSYGGRGAGDVSEDNGLWTYNPATESWKLQQTSIKPTRYQAGASVDARDVQSAFWVGGYSDSSTTPAITDSTRDYSPNMLQFNTTTGELGQLDAPFAPVQNGGLVYIPAGKSGILVFMGGETPSIANGINATLTPNTWDHVQVYDIAENKWYNQTTTGTTAERRSEFCATVHQDPSSSSYQIYVVGGYDWESEKLITEVSYLSIPSFKWYQAGGLDKGRMSLTCQAYGRQIFGVGGRLALANGQGAGCYTMPAFIYDAQSEVTRTSFNPGLSGYSIPSSTKDDIEKSSYPSTWAADGLKDIFIKSSTNSSTTDTASSSSGSNQSKSSQTGAIVGGVVGGVVGAAIIVALGFFIRRRRQPQNPSYGKQDEDERWNKPELPTKGVEVNEISAREVPKPELPTHERELNEMPAGETRAELLA
ncbi:hypothetical protein AWENTII_009365 [Aspergillus wentii]